MFHIQIDLDDQGQGHHSLRLKVNFKMIQKSSRSQGITQTRTTTEPKTICLPQLGGEKT